MWKGDLRMQCIKIPKLIEKMNLKNLTPEISLEECRITIPDINRPALQLTGYFEHFEMNVCRLSDMWNILIYKDYPEKEN